MATVEKALEKRTLCINVKNGMNADGTDKVKGYSYNKVKETAADADIFAVGYAMAGLMDKELADISISERSVLTEVM